MKPDGERWEIIERRCFHKLGVVYEQWQDFCGGEMEHHIHVLNELTIIVSYEATEGSVEILTDESKS